MISDHRKWSSGGPLSGSAVYRSFGSRLEHSALSAGENKVVKLGLLTADQYIDAFQQYRGRWALLETGGYRLRPDDAPLCVDIEIASICDLACPYCFRSSVVTPDKVMPIEDYKRILDQVVELGCPSIKLNWRGEPLLNPKVYEMIKLAKEAGILDVIINTNGTKLGYDSMLQLAEAGLDFIIISVDGATAQTYEKNRPGRFRHNTFEALISNIKAAWKVKTELGFKYPYVRIQGVGTPELLKEADLFLRELGSSCDEIAINPYSDRGLPVTFENGIVPPGDELPLLVMKDGLGNDYAAYRRKPCMQPSQRMMVTYDGRVAACCYDWGAQHAMGYVLAPVSELSDDPELIVSDRVAEQRPGYKELGAPKLATYSPITSDLTCRSLSEIWRGQAFSWLRSRLDKNDYDNIKMCDKCDFKDTYDWVKI